MGRRRARRRASSIAARGSRRRSTGPRPPATDAGLNRLEREFLEESRTAFGAREPAAARAARRWRWSLLARGRSSRARSRCRRAGRRGSRRRRRSRSGSARRRSSSRSLDRALLLAREGVELDDYDRDAAATCSRRCCAARRRWPSCTARGDAGTRRRAQPDGRLLVAARQQRQRLVLRHATLREVGAALQGRRAAQLLRRDRPAGAGARVQPRRPDARRRRQRRPPCRRSHLVDAAQHVAARHAASRAPAATADVVFAPDGRTLVTGEAVSCASSPPRGACSSLRRASDGSVLRRSRSIPGGRLIGFTPDGRFLLVNERRDHVATCSTRARSPACARSRLRRRRLSPDGDQPPRSDRTTAASMLVDLRSGASARWTDARRAR